MQPGYTALADEEYLELEDDDAVEALLVATCADSLLLNPEPGLTRVAYIATSVVAPESAVVAALMSVGVIVPPYTMTSEVVVKPMDRRFDALAQSYVFIEDSVVVSWDIPELGCQDLTRSQCENMQLNSGERLIHGSGHSTLAVTGWRPKLDGLEAVQFVAHTARGETHAFLWYGTTIRRVVAHSSALYECIGYGTPAENFKLLAGTPADRITWSTHDWRALDYHTMSNFSDTEGIVVRANAMEYRVKTKKTFNLHVSALRSTDQGGEEYTVTGVEPSAFVSIAEVVWQSGRTCSFLRWRPDRLRADTKEHITKVIRSVSFAEFMDYIPYAENPGVGVLSRLVMAPRGPLHKHRVLHRNSRGLAPYSWGNTDHQLSDYLASFAREVCTQHGQIDAEMLHQELREQGKYSSSGYLYNLYPSTPGPFRCVLMDDWIYTPIPLATTSRIVVRNALHCSRRVTERFSACVHEFRGERFLIYYGSLRQARYRWAVHGRYQYRVLPQVSE